MPAENEQSIIQGQQVLVHGATENCSFHYAVLCIQNISALVDLMPVGSQRIYPLDPAKPLEFPVRLPIEYFFSSEEAKKAGLDILI